MGIIAGLQLVVALLHAQLAAAAHGAMNGLSTFDQACPQEMVQVRDSCVDRYEASLVELDDAGEEVPFSPFRPPTRVRVRAVSEAGRTPQAHISMLDAERACRASQKRLCHAEEWVTACRGPDRTRYPYGDHRVPGLCIDAGRTAPLAQLYSEDRRYRPESMNDPRLNQLAGTVAEAGSAPQCTNAFGAFDMVGNLHEWVDDGTFRGGYYLDDVLNGEGCGYTTRAHARDYFDYSTGFRCCTDARL